MLPEQIPMLVIKTLEDIALIQRVPTAQNNKAIGYRDPARTLARQFRRPFVVNSLRKLVRQPIHTTIPLIAPPTIPAWRFVTRLWVGRGCERGAVRPSIL